LAADVYGAVVIVLAIASLLAMVRSGHHDKTQANAAGVRASEQTR